MVILLVRRLKDNQKRLTPANGISLNFIHASKVLPDSNNYKNGILRTYINGMADQTIEIGRLKINNAYILNINGKNKLILRKAQ